MTTRGSKTELHCCPDPCKSKCTPRVEQLVCTLPCRKSRLNPAYLRIHPNHRGFAVFPREGVEEQVGRSEALKVECRAEMMGGYCAGKAEAIVGVYFLIFSVHALQYINQCGFIEEVGPHCPSHLLSNCSPHKLHSPVATAY